MSHEAVARLEPYSCKLASIVAYLTTVGLVCLWAGEVFRVGRGSLPVIGQPPAYGLTIAALLDGVENVVLLRLLDYGAVSPWPQIVRWCAIPKAILVYAGLFHSLVGFAVVLWVLLAALVRSI